MQNDDELYSSFLSGNNSAYDELMIRYGDSLTIYMNAYLHNWQDSEDMMIEAFARIMVKKPRIGEGCFKAYLYKTARNLATRFHSRKKEAFSLDEMETELADTFSLEEKVSDMNLHSILHVCMERIDADVREALWLVYFENMSYIEAANIMKVNRKRIDRLLQKGKEHLRRELEKEGITKE
ncbi:MAG: RNA polymerase sigma factor [Eubacterium sp.]|nr:RNA polymerase sigma factor [Eubacterium sp.]